MLYLMTQLDSELYGDKKLLWRRTGFDRCPTLNSVALRKFQIRNKTASIRNLVLTRFRLHSDIMLLLKSIKFALLS